MPAAALGAQVTLRAGGTTRRDFVKLTEGFRAQVPLDLHFGLGDATTIAELEVRWPSGETDAWRDLPVDRLLVVDQDAGTVADEPLKRWSDGSRPTVMGSPSPTLTAQVLDGDRAPLAGGRPAVINFWAPWCAPCNVELPQLVELAGRYTGEVDFAGISVELDDLDSVRESIDRFGIPYPQFLATKHSWSGSSGPRTRRRCRQRSYSIRKAACGGCFGRRDGRRVGCAAGFLRDEAVSEDTLRMLAETYGRAGDYARAAEFYGQLGALEPTRLDQIGQAWQRQRALTGSPRPARIGRWARWRMRAKATIGRCRWSRQPHGAPRARSAWRTLI